MTNPWMRFLRHAALLLAGAVVAAGCSTISGVGKGGGKLAIRSQAEVPAVLRGGFEAGIYSFDDKNNLTVVLFNGPMDNPAQAATIRVFWQPRAGKTPIDQTATNATIHYMVFTGATSAQAGVYSGAGFVYPEDEPGGEVFHGAVWQADVVLQDSSAGFRDLLGQARLTGTFTARRDDARVLDAIRHLDVMLRQRLGYPRFVKSGGEQNNTIQHRPGT